MEIDSGNEIQVKAIRKPPLLVNQEESMALMMKNQ